jgi:dienelactone hydrolase
MQTFTIEYFDDTALCKGYLVRPDSDEELLPIVLIASTWQGLNHFTIEKANQVAQLGYIAFAIDVYGEGKIAEESDRAAELMAPFFLDRAMLQKRMQAAYNQAGKISGADPAQIGAIGFCFGGLCILELLRSGAFLKGAVSFHGVLGDTLQDKKADLAPSKINPKSSFLLMHGYKDPLVSMEDVVKLQKELSLANIDWQAHIYGLAGHAFTNPELKDESTHFCFEPYANYRSFQSMTAYFKEKFS